MRIGDEYYRCHMDGQGVVTVTAKVTRIGPVNAVIEFIRSDLKGSMPDSEASDEFKKKYHSSKVAALGHLLVAIRADIMGIFEKLESMCDAKWCILSEIDRVKNEN